jgi:glyoxylase-like metal-dependent hydrolase (beta-lactamase superfamily II)
MERLPVRQIVMPTPYAVGPVNAYLIEADPVTLIDAGIDTPQARNAMWLELHAAGFFPESIEQVIVTHGHPDHYGLIAEIQEVSGATVYFPSREIERVRDKQMLFQVGKLLVGAGMPLDLLFKMDQERRRNPQGNALRDSEVVPIDEGKLFDLHSDLGDFTLEALHMPGHTGGHMVFFEPRTRSLFAGDQLLPDTSPNPLLEPSLDDPSERRRSLKEYLVSLEKMAALDATVAFPGHGGIIEDPGALITSTIEHHNKRKVRIAGMLSDQPRSPYELAQEMYPDVGGYDVFLSVSEVIAHLDLIVDDSDAVVSERDGVIYYQAT